MPARMVTLARFSDSVDAHAARGHLERRGIAAIVIDELSSRGARLQVDASHTERARELLLDEVSSATDLSGYWRCIDCQVVVDPGFDVCWSCLRPRQDVIDPEFRPTMSQITEDDTAETPALHETLTLRRPTQLTPGQGSIASAQLYGLEILPRTAPEDRIMRAWHAAIVGLIVLPPLLNIYSMYLLVRVCIGLPSLSRPMMRRFCAALFFNFLSGFAVGVYRWLGLF